MTRNHSVQTRMSRGLDSARRTKKGRDVSQGSPEQRLLTVAEVADMLRVSNMTVYRLIKRGELTAIRVGKNYRIRQQALDDYLDQGAVGTEQESG